MLRVQSPLQLRRQRTLVFYFAYFIIVHKYIKYRYLPITSRPAPSCSTYPESVLGSSSDAPVRCRCDCLLYIGIGNIFTLSTVSVSIYKYNTVFPRTRFHCFCYTLICIHYTYTHTHTYICVPISIIMMLVCTSRRAHLIALAYLLISPSLRLCAAVFESRYTVVRVNTRRIQYMYVIHCTLTSSLG